MGTHQMISKSAYHGTLGVGLVVARPICLNNAICLVLPSIQPELQRWQRITLYAQDGLDRNSMECVDEVFRLTEATT